MRSGPGSVGSTRWLWTGGRRGAEAGAGDGRSEPSPAGAESLAAAAERWGEVAADARSREVCGVGVTAATVDAVGRAVPRDLSQSVAGLYVEPVAAVPIPAPLPYVAVNVV